MGGGQGAAIVASNAFYQERKNLPNSPQKVSAMPHLVFAVSYVSLAARESGDILSGDILASGKISPGTKLEC